MNVFMQNEKLWLDILTSFINTYRGPYESDLLATLTPLLVATLDHSRRSIKRQAVQFWAATFGKSLQLEYPDALKPILERIRRKVTIVLPGLATSSTVVGGTPAAAVMSYDPFKGDIWAVGMILLECSSTREAKDFYDY